uniref:Uncharacterized protein n=1 Tax=Arundo donax TaxID=35708 RepID=A0A0A9DK39_ARUDO
MLAHAISPNFGTPARARVALACIWLPANALTSFSEPTSRAALQLTLTPTPARDEGVQFGRQSVGNRGRAKFWLGELCPHPNSPLKPYMVLELSCQV